MEDPLDVQLGLESLPLVNRGGLNDYVGLLGEEGEDDVANGDEWNPVLAAWS